QAVPVSWLAGNQLYVRGCLKSFGCPSFPRLTGSDSSPAFNDCHFATLFAQLLANEIGSLFAHCDIVRGDERFNVGTGLLEAVHVNFFIQVDQKYSLFVGLRYYRHQVDWRERSERNPFVAFVKDILERGKLRGHIAFRWRRVDVYLHSELLRFGLHTLFHLLPEWISKRL